MVDPLGARASGTILAAGDLEIILPTYEASGYGGGEVPNRTVGCRPCHRPPRTLGGRAMIVVHIKVQCQPEKTEQVKAAFEEVIAPSRAVDGVISFDIARDLANPNSFIAIEVFEDHAALERQESLPEVAKTLAVLEHSLAAEPEATIFHLSFS